MSDYDRYKNGITNMFGKQLDDNTEDPDDLCMQMFGKSQSELDDWEYQEYMAQLALLAEDLS